MLIFVDETGTNKPSSLRKYGYALKGEQAIAEKVLVRGKRHSVISAMGIDGILDILITTQHVNGELFYEFVDASFCLNYLHLMESIEIVLSF